MIEFKNVVKSFGQKTVLNKVSFKIERGQIVFILGISGTGKSVMLKNIVGLLTPDAGEIWVDGVDAAKLSEESYGPIRKKCGMVFQQPALFDSMTVFENIAFGLRKHFQLPESEIKSRVLKALSLVNLDDIGERFPSNISYGMQKRVSLARTIIIEPEILLFDEPTTGLDPITTNAINSLIQDLSRRLKTTSLVVSHDMNCALAIADRIIVLDRGMIVEDGTVESVRNSKVPLVKDFLAEV